MESTWLSYILMNNKLQTIHIEGLDLAGKSTICRYIQQAYSYQRRVNSLLLDNPMHREADRLRKLGEIDDAALGRLYYESLLYDLDNYVPPDVPTIQDSTILVRSIAFHSVFGDKGLAEDFRLLMPRHPRFALSVMLTASDDVRKMRLKGRISRHNDNPEDYLIHTNPRGFHEMENIILEIIKHDFGGIVIDSSNLEQDGEKERVAQMILEAASE